MIEHQQVRRGSLSAAVMADSLSLFGRQILHEFSHDALEDRVARWFRDENSAFIPYGANDRINAAAFNMALSNGYVRVLKTINQEGIPIELTEFGREHFHSNNKGRTQAYNASEWER